MTTTLEQPLTPDEPKAVHDQDLPNPAFDDSSYKAIAEKFRANWNPKPAADDSANKTGDQIPSNPDHDAGGGPKSAQAKPSEVVAEKAVDTATVDEFPEPPQNSPITRQDFARLAQSRKDYKAQAEKAKADQEVLAAKARQLEDELNKTKASLPPNLEEIQKSLADAKRIADEHKALTEQLETINLERSPRFQNWWKTETDKHLKVAKNHLPVEVRDQVAKLMMESPSTERDAAIDAIIESLPKTSRRLVDGALEAIESLRIQREDALTQGSARWKELQEHEKAESAKQQSAREQRLADIQTKAIARSKNYSAFQPTGDPALDAEIPQREAFVRAAVAGQLNEDVLLSMPAISLDYLHLTEKVVPGLKSEIAKQADLIKQLQGAGPTAGDGKTSNTRPDTKSEKDGTSFATHVRSLWQGK